MTDATGRRGARVALPSIGMGDRRHLSEAPGGLKIKRGG